MSRVRTITRRRMMQLAGATAVTTLPSGCLFGGPPDRGPPDGGPPDGGPDDDSNDGDGGVEFDPGTDIEFSAQTSHWEGLAPSSIEGAENPTLILQEGEDYTIGWTEGDGAGHNIEIRDENDEVVNDLATEVVSEPGEDQILEFTASSEMAQYVCDPHETTMRGNFQLER